MQSLLTFGFVLFALFAGLFAAPTPTARAADDVVIRGGGWGHGVGGSQYGFLGNALEGKKAAQITKYYYSGSSVKKLGQIGLDDLFIVSGQNPMWVALPGLQARTTVTFKGINGPLELCQSGDGEGECPKDSAQPKAGENWSFRVDGGGCQFFKGNEPMGEPGGCRGGITWDAGSRIEVDGKQYARGEIKIRPIPGSNNFHVSLAIGLEDYMYGLAEVPPSWHPQALRAQALAGRSYALYRYLQFEDPGLRTQADAGLSTSRQAQCWCHIYATTIDQAYTGWSHESQGNWGRWRDAVDATRRRVITHPTSINTQQTVIQAFYSSSTGGRTENSEDKWVTEVPWLRTKPDGWSQAEVNPHGSWSTIRTPSSFAATLGFSEVSNAEILEVYESGSPKRIRVSGKRNGSDAVEEYTGSQFASRFGLRSHYVWEIDGGFGGGGGGGGGGGSAPTCNGLEATIVGTAGDDVIEGTSGDDVIVARAGDDTIRAKGGDDTICAGAGDDTIAAGGGGDWVNGQAGTDTIDFSASTDPVDVTLKGLVATGQGSDVVKGIENVVGSPGDDRIIGNNKANRLEGGDGDDALRGRGGGDVIIGGPGADDLAGGLGPDRLDGSGGNDLVNYADSGEAVTINLGSGEAAGGEGNDELVSIEAAMASIHDDLLVGSTGEDRLLGLAGDDTIEGRSGNDDLRGNGGTDTINGGNGNDLCRGENLTKCER